ncbi:hypothetical protein N8I84_36870 [Streptomyces cynarae]|uniref:Uncharacterized protein n=1 Tax=Streptomyces cynarae TaxID=2981134 RepID=A0ABY6ECM0_9ACTN|nr:hypothetical protein [Streptomyces cynarae]UXY23648.1 hypothetical protein N8I84_36870 [Streptomyces cynarae]
MSTTPLTDGRPTSEPIADQVLERVLARPLRPWERGIEGKYQTGEFALDLSLVNLVEVCAAREAIETQPRQLCPPPPGTAIDRTVRELADSVGQRSDTGGGGGLATT